MPAAGREDSKYVRRIHFGRYPHRTPTHWRTACGKNVQRIFTTRDPARITCKTCRVCRCRSDKEDPQCSS